MATAEQTYLRSELEQRRERLHTALHSPAADASLSQLLTAVDDALRRIDQGTFGICETCHDSVEPERLLADPLVRFCLDHLTSTEQRALESDLSLAARIQRRLLPECGLTPKGWDVGFHYQPAGMVRFYSPTRHSVGELDVYWSWSGTTGEGRRSHARW